MALKPQDEDPYAAGDAAMRAHAEMYGEDEGSRADTKAPSDSLEGRLDGVSPIPIEDDEVVLLHSGTLKKPMPKRLSSLTTKSLELRLGFFLKDSPGYMRKAIEVISKKGYSILTAGGEICTSGQDLDNPLTFSYLEFIAMPVSVAHDLLMRGCNVHLYSGATPREKYTFRERSNFEICYDAEHGIFATFMGDGRMNFVEQPEHLGITVVAVPSGDLTEVDQLEKIWDNVASKMSRLSSGLPPHNLTQEAFEFRNANLPRSINYLPYRIANAIARRYPTNICASLLLDLVGGTYDVFRK
ncbi:TPA: hypothetical protein HA246_05905 [Candidatus Woesearchaeota archaeon]|nr:hypothetical protein [Candidatus Woesearchaeota archaeon]